MTCGTCGTGSFTIYLPEKLAELYGLIIGEMGQELLRVKQRIEERRV